MKKYILFSILIVGFSVIEGLAQPILVTPSSNFGNFNHEAYLENSATQVSNLSYVGDPLAYGHFSNSNPSFSLNYGLILTSGKATNAIGPNNASAMSYNSSGPSSPLLDSIIPQNTQDAAILEFDIISCDTVYSISFIFGSEEYLEWVNSSFNDCAGIFVSGPSPTGGFYENQNFALIPGTNANICVNNINNINNAAYYNSNGSGATPGTEAIQYDGYTDPFNANIPIIPGQVYHIIIAIADGGDSVGDSGIFIKAGDQESLQDVSISIQSPYGTGTDLFEGNTTALRFQRNMSVGNLQSLPVFLSYYGNSTPGIDYSAIPGIVVIPSGSNYVDIPVEIYDDGIVENPESVIITEYTTCNFAVDTIEFFIHDNFQFEAGIIQEEAIMCEGDEFLISTFANSADSMLNYLWSTGSTTDTIWISGNANTAAIYTVTISHVDGYSSIDSVQVFVSPAMELQTILYPDICQQDSAEVLVTGGNSPFTYQWSTGETTSLASDLGYPWNNVTVTDAYGCSKIQVVNPSPGPVDIFSYITNYCDTNLGAIQIWSNLAASLYDIVWGNGFTSNILDSLIPGTYNVTITDMFGCNNDTAITLNPQPISTSFSYSMVGCITSIAEVDASGGNPPYTYLWSTGSTDDISYCNQSGIYWVTVTDAEMCIKVDSFELSANPTDSLIISDTLTYNCNPYSGNVDITIQHGQSPFTYLWSTGETTEDLIDQPPGMYSITIVDGNFCHETESFEIQDYLQLTVQENISPVSNCSTYDNGALSLIQAHGIQPYYYQWSTGDTTSIIDSLGMGVYYYTVTDACGSTVENSLEIEYSLSHFCTVEKTNAVCSNGFGSIFFDPGTSPMWCSLNNGPTFYTYTTFDSLSVGTYMIYLTFQWTQCIDSFEVEIGFADDFIQLDTNVVTVDCPGDEVELHAGYAGAPYEVTQIAYDTIPVSSNATRLPDLLDDQVTGPLPVGFDFSFFGHSYSEFYLGSNGWICFIPVSGTGSYSNIYQIPVSFPGFPHAAIMPAFRDWLPPVYMPGGGIYYETIGASPFQKLVITFKDIALFSCTTLFGDFQVVLYENQPYVDINLTRVPVCPSWQYGRGVCGIQNEEGNLAYTVPGRNNTPWEAYNESWRFTPTTIHWYNPDGIQVGIGEQVSFSAETPGTYYTEYTSVCGTETDSFEIFFNHPALPTHITPAAICEGQDYLIGLPGWDYYLWDTGETTASIEIAGAGIYSVSVASGNCHWSDEASIGYEENTNEYPYSPYVCESDTLYFQLEPDYNYLWFDGSLDSSYVITASGNYHVTVSSANCTWHDSIDVLLRALPLGILPSDTTMCLNYTFEIGAGATSYSYIWNNGSSNVVLITDTVGLFIVDKSDAYGCSITDSVSITYQPNVISAFQFFEAFNHVNFVNQSQDAYSFFWDFGDGSPISTEANPEHDYPVLNQNMWYTATLISANQCGSDTSTLQIFTFDIEEMSEESPISIFPNPNQGNFFLSGSLESKDDLQVHILNSTGQEIYRKEISSTKGKISEEIKLGKVAPGMYYLMVQQKELKWVWKMVVE